MTEETRNWTQLANENIMLHEQLRQLRLEQAKDRTRTYQTTGDGVAEIDNRLVAFMIGVGVAQADRVYDEGITEVVDAAIEAWKARGD